jgi:hypothetical protein
MWVIIDEMLNFSKFPKMSGFVLRFCVTNHKYSYAFNENEIVRINFYDTETTALLCCEDQLLNAISENNTYKVIQTNECTVWSVRRFDSAAYAAQV